MVRQTVEKAKVPNFLIVAIDTQLRDYLTEKGVNVYYKDIQARSPASLEPQCCLFRHPFSFGCHTSCD
jgi:hypothetical protein